MIAKLTGLIDSTARNSLILDVNGVGYQVSASARTLSKIGRKGDRASLLIEMIVREDAMLLYGFADEAEQAWFRLLTSVQGVGPKAGMAILSAVPPDKLGFAIASGDKAALTQADGVGPKLALRILTELKDKAGKMTVAGGGNEEISVARSGKESAVEEGGDIDSDAVSALVNLGYSRSDAYRAVLNARQKSNDNSKVNDLIKLALKELAS